MRGSRNPLFELSHDSRLGMLRRLGQGSRRHGELFREMNLSPSEATRHLGRLVSMDAVRKNKQGEFEITRVGIHIIDMLEDLDFMLGNSEYLETHDFSFVPDELALFSMLRRASEVRGAADIMAGLADISTGARDRLDCMFDRVIDHLVPEHVRLLRDGVTVNILVNDDSGIPGEFLENHLLSLEIRVIDRIPGDMAVSDAGGIVVPGHVMGYTDYSVGFGGQDSAFLEWCGSIFDHYWSMGRPVSL